MSLNFGRLRNEQCGINDIIWSWKNKSENTRDDFDRFYFLWSQFNAWGLIVTLAKYDSKMIDLLSKNRNIQQIYSQKIQDENRRYLRNDLNECTSSFPLPSYADLVRIDHRYPWKQNQGNAEYWGRISRAQASGKSVKMSPRLHPTDWESVLHCMYAVRCNLFHGSKVASEGERNFINCFSNVLDMMMNERGGLFDLG